MMEADPIKASEIINVLNVDTSRFQIPQYYSKVKEVVDYFSTFPNMRYYLLKVTSGAPDRLEKAWNYVALQKEREALLNSFTAEEFAPDIEEQLTNKFLTQDNISRIRQDVDTKKQLIAEREVNRKHTAEFHAQKEGAVKKINLKEVERKLDNLENINKIINKYE